MNESVKRNGMIAVAVVLVAVAAYAVWNNFGEDPAVKMANTVTCICAETGEVFQFELKPGEAFPSENPDTGNKSLFRAEMCYWNECGERGGTAVLMNTYRGEKEPTHCPVCGHVVRFHNPRPPEYTGQ